MSRGYYNSAFMLGNMGFNKAVCVSTYVQMTTAEPSQLTCEIGEISDVVHYGILAGDLTYTWENVAYGYCGAFDNEKIGSDVPT